MFMFTKMRSRDVRSVSMISWLTFGVFSAVCGYMTLFSQLTIRQSFRISAVIIGSLDKMD